MSGIPNTAAAAPSGKQPRRAPRPWTDAELAALAEARSLGPKALAERLNRPLSSVRLRLFRLRRDEAARKSERQCLACDQWLPLSAFGFHGNAHGLGRRRTCRACERAERARARRHAPSPPPPPTPAQERPARSRRRTETPPCDLCAHQARCTVECAAFRRWAKTGLSVEPPFPTYPAQPVIATGGPLETSA